MFEFFGNTKGLFYLKTVPVSVTNYASMLGYCLWHRRLAHVPSRTVQSTIPHLKGRERERERERERVREELRRVRDRVLQLVTRPTRDRLIAGSNPTPGDRCLLILAMCGALVVWPETSVSNSLVSLNAAGGPLSFFLKQQPKRVWRLGI